jgi:hypothetical protein
MAKTEGRGGKRKGAFLEKVEHRGPVGGQPNVQVTFVDSKGRVFPEAGPEMREV